MSCKAKILKKKLYFKSLLNHELSTGSYCMLELFFCLGTVNCTFEGKSIPFYYYYFFLFYRNALLAHIKMLRALMLIFVFLVLLTFFHDVLNSFMFEVL